MVKRGEIHRLQDALLWWLGMAASGAVLGITYSLNNPIIFIVGAFAGVLGFIILLGMGLSDHWPQ